MSESNGKPAQVNRLDRAKFYKVLKAFEERAEEFKQTRPSLADASSMLSTMVGFEVGRETVKDIRTMTGVTWTPKTKSGKRSSGGIHKQTALRALARAVEELYRDLGKAVPEGVTTLMKQLDVRRRESEDAKMPSDR